MTRSTFSSLASFVPTGFAPLAFVATALFTVPAHAETLSFAGFADGSKSVDIVLGGANAARRLTAQAGGFQASLDGGPSFTSFCIDLYESIDFGTPYTDYTLGTGATHAFNNANAATDLGKLFAGNHTLNSATRQAAFQIAVWEIAYETTGAAYDVRRGAATFSGGSAATSGALDLASDWLEDLAATTNNLYAIRTLESVGRPGHQDQAFAAPIPEPSTYALLAGGLLAIGAFARRRVSQED